MLECCATVYYKCPPSVPVFLLTHSDPKRYGPAVRARAGQHGSSALQRNAQRVHVGPEPKRTHAESPCAKYDELAVYRFWGGRMTGMAPGSRADWAWLDSISEIGPGERQAVARRRFTTNEWYFAHHFPAFPVVP